MVDEVLPDSELETLLLDFLFDLCDEAVNSFTDDVDKILFFSFDFVSVFFEKHLSK